MTSLPESLVQLRSDLEEAIGREQATRARQGERRRRVAVLVAVVVVVVGTASAFASVREFFTVEPLTVSRTVEGVRFSLSVPRSGWGKGPNERIGGVFRTGSLFISKSTAGPQDAEAVIFWSSFPHGNEAAPCGKLLSSAGGSTADLAAAVARAPGIAVLSGPTRVTVGGRPAQHVTVSVRKDIGCDPGFFYTWRPRGPRGQCFGACWTESSVGDTIRVWIVAVDGKRLFIEAETAKRGDPSVDQEITKIIESIRFE